jgi:pimeloyl-ACP methyl ester carboxylesterase
MNYRGYGGSDGTPSETALLSDALFVFDYMLATEGIDPAHVVLMGRSLGSGVAVHVAAKRKVGGVILVTPFDSLVNVARAHYPIFPVGLMLKHRFDSAALAPGITTPGSFSDGIQRPGGAGAVRHESRTGVGRPDHCRQRGGDRPQLNRNVAGLLGCGQCLPVILSPPMSERNVRFYFF